MVQSFDLKTSVVLLSGLLTSAALAVNIAAVPVGDLGNVGEFSGHDFPSSTPGRICGSVGHAYNIAKYEVTAGQYTEFLNKVAVKDTYGLYNPLMWTANYGCRIQRQGSQGSYMYSVAVADADRPVNYVSYWDACRFANWLHNGQPSGEQVADVTETGTYTLSGYNGEDGWDIVRNPGGTWALPSEDEWYKAAYYDPTTGSYFDYPTRSNTAPGRDLADPNGNNANCWTGSGAWPIEPGKYTTMVGEFQNSASPYGTFDQGGNVHEWHEGIVGEVTGHPLRGYRGGSFYDGTNTLTNMLQASVRGYQGSTYEYANVGFRVAQVPEPATLAILAVAGLVVIRGRSRIGS